MTAILPLELEREIFELCALSRTGSIPRLMLVAHRVKDWVEPLLYRVIALNAPFPGFPLFTDDIMSSLINRKSPKFFHDTVRHLITFRRSKVEDTMLALCTGVEDLYLCLNFRADISFLKIIQSLPVTRLYALSYSMTPSAIRIFSRLTHLHLVAYHPDDVDPTCAALAALPHLTRLALDSEKLALASHTIFELSPSLHVLVLFKHPETRMADAIAPLAREDVRFVVIPQRVRIREWFAAIQHGESYWSDAESFVAKR
ncbi:hypothetical protein B0H14DRAFT_1158961 [Mycena olivaceomarginata]|nr:hypothetical protein B0H14DRAFT_1158961 [Mycena olivaceomarginata]